VKKKRSRDQRAEKMARGELGGALWYWCLPKKKKGLQKGGRQAKKSEVSNLGLEGRVRVKKTHLRRQKESEKKKGEGDGGTEGCTIWGKVEIQPKDPPVAKEWASPS